MSNFDHTIDDGMEEALRSDPDATGAHAAWNFFGQVWFADGKFHEEVWRHGSPIETISADSLRELMEEVNSRHGSD